MTNLEKKCNYEGHEDINANFYCPDCKIYICKKCETFHNKFFKRHKLYGLNNDINNIFTGFCQKNNHLEKLEYFCKTHNELCCASCIVKLKKEGKGQHTDCDICLIENIKEEKNEILKQNIKYLEDLSKNIKNLINELKENFKEINESKEELKLKIMKIFTDIRNKVNEREDFILFEVDKIYNETYIEEKKLKEIDKLPKIIQTSLEKAKISEKDLADINKLSSAINDCIGIEKNVLSINQNNEIVNKMKKEKNKNIKFYPDEKFEISEILTQILNFGKIYIDNNNINTKDIFNVEINSLTKEETQDSFCVQFNGFNKDKFNNYYPENAKYNKNEIITTFFLEAKNKNNVDLLSNMIKKRLSEYMELNKYSATISIRKDKNKLFFDFIREIDKKDKDNEEIEENEDNDEEKELVDIENGEEILVFDPNNEDKIEIDFDKEDTTYKLFLNFNEYTDISLNFKSNITFRDLLKLNYDQLILTLFSLIIKLNIKLKNIDRLEKVFEKFVDGDILIALLNIIRSLQQNKFELRFSPKILLKIFKDKGNEKYSFGDMKLLKEEMKRLLNKLNEEILKGALKYMNLDNFGMSILFMENKSGFSLNVNANGLTEVINELIFPNKIN